MNRRWLLGLGALAIAVPLLFLLVPHAEEEPAPIQPLPAQRPPAPPPRSATITPALAQRPSAPPARPAPVVPSNPTVEAVNLPKGTQLKFGTTDTPWELIAPGDLVDNFGYDQAKEFMSGLTSAAYQRFASCADNYEPPESVRSLGSFQGTMVLDVQSSVDGYEIVEAGLGDARFADDALEQCLRNVYKGVRIQANSAQPNMRWRIKQGVVFGFNRKLESQTAPVSR